MAAYAQAAADYAQVAAAYVRSVRIRQTKPSYTGGWAELGNKKNGQ